MHILLVFLCHGKPVEERMPKLKTNRAAAKRFKATGTGKIMRARANKSHILTKKSPDRKRRLRQTTLVDPINVRALRRMMPYL
jgi:large subunit ribosomal protein L35